MKTYDYPKELKKIKNDHLLFIEKCKDRPTIYTYDFNNNLYIRFYQKSYKDLWFIINNYKQKTYTDAISEIHFAELGGNNIEDNLLKVFKGRLGFRKSGQQ